MKKLEKKDLLIVEDEIPLAQLLRISFEKENLKVDIAESVEKAIEKLKNTKYKVILSDYNLPDSYNLTGLERLTDAAPKISLVLMSAYDLPVELLKSRYKNLKFFVPKPFTFPELNKIISKFL